jgi:hypothetical protein
LNTTNPMNDLTATRQHGSEHDFLGGARALLPVPESAFEMLQNSPNDLHFFRDFSASSAGRCRLLRQGNRSRVLVDLPFGSTAVSQ